MVVGSAALLAIRTTDDITQEPMWQGAPSGQGTPTKNAQRAVACQASSFVQLVVGCHWMQRSSDGYCLSLRVPT
jgi:hypothetical protein